MNPTLDNEFEDRIQAVGAYWSSGEPPTADIGGSPTVDLEPIFTHIQQWRDSYPDRLRSDAAYFLIVNAELLIAGPLVSAGAPSDEVEIGLQNDLEVILNQVQGEPGEVSAHRMLEIIAERWRDLRLTQSRLWD